MILMCKNAPVYDIEQEKVLNQALLPGYMREKGACSHTFTQWMNTAIPLAQTPWHAD